MTEQEKLIRKITIKLSPEMLNALTRMAEAIHHEEQKGKK